MSHQESIPLSASELGYLWTGYSINEMSKWFLTIFQNQAKDNEIQEVFSNAMTNTTELLSARKELISQEGYSVPLGFSQQDIDTSAPRLFSDKFLILYLHVGTRLGMEFHSKCLSISARVDVREYAMKCLHSSSQLYDSILNLLLNKGLYWRTPSLPSSTQNEFIHKTSYLNGWFGDSRPINSMEIANHYALMDLLVMMETLFIGFAQTTDSDETVELLLKGVEQVKSQYSELADLLRKNELPVPPSFSAEVTDSKLRIFSDRIMVTHMAGLFGSLLSQYGFSLGCLMKHDMVITYLEHISKAGAFSEKITRFLIEREWLEKVPGVSSK
jgi:hypothetical protein